MNERHEDLFPRLEPPPGGLVRLRARLDRDRGRALRTRWTIAFAGAFAAIALALAWWGVIPDQAGPHATAALDLSPGADHPTLRQMRGLVPDEPVTLVGEARGRVALQRVQTSDDKVIFYMVGTIE